MRCKVGDICVIVRVKSPLAHFLGKLCEVKGPALGVGDWSVEVFGHPASHGPDATYGAFDHQLRPLRDSDGEDEMLRIAGKPTETPTEIIREVADATGN